MGKKLRDGISSRVWRKVIDESMNQTIFGTKTVSMHWCKTCRQHKPRNNFYTESNSKSNAFEKLRNQCIPCWDLYEGKINPPKHGEAVLVEFLK